MLTIDDPELEQFIREEAARTGEEPAALLRRLLRTARRFDASEPPDDEETIPFEAWPVRNGIRCFPRRPGEAVVTLALVRRLLGEDE